MVRLLAVMALVACAGCTVPNKTTQEDNSEVLKSISYVRDTHGNCLAVVASRTYYGYNVISLTQVDKGCK